MPGLEHVDVVHDGSHFVRVAATDRRHCVESAGEADAGKRHDGGHDVLNKAEVRRSIHFLHGHRDRHAGSGIRFAGRRPLDDEFLPFDDFGYAERYGNAFLACSNRHLCIGIARKAGREYSAGKTFVKFDSCLTFRICFLCRGACQLKDYSFQRKFQIPVGYRNVERRRSQAGRAQRCSQRHGEYFLHVVVSPCRFVRPENPQFPD